MATVRNLGFFPRDQSAEPEFKDGWCSQEKFVNEQAPNVELSLEEAIALFWRVKTIRCTNSLNEIPASASVRYRNEAAVVRYISNLPPSENEEPPDPDPFRIQPFAETETDLVLASSRLFWQRTEQVGLDRTQVGILFDNAYTPLTPQIGVEFIGQEIVVSSDGTIFPDAVVAGQCELSFFQYRKSFNLYTNPEWLLGGHSALIEATEYWPYDSGDGGGPIYDSVTGEQLRAFP